MWLYTAFLLVETRVYEKEKESEIMSWGTERKKIDKLRVKWDIGIERKISGSIRNTVYERWEKEGRLYEREKDGVGEWKERKEIISKRDTERSGGKEGSDRVWDVIKGWQMAVEEWK